MGFSRQEYWSGLPCLPLGKEGGHIDVREKTFLERALGGLQQCLSYQRESGSDRGTGRAGRALGMLVKDQRNENLIRLGESQE